MVSETIFVAGVTIGFERTNYFVDEGNVVDVCVVLTGTLGRSLDVFVNSSSGSATGTNQVLQCSPKGLLSRYL